MVTARRFCGGAESVKASVSDRSGRRNRKRIVLAKRSEGAARRTRREGRIGFDPPMFQELHERVRRITLSAPAYTTKIKTSASVYTTGDMRVGRGEMGVKEAGRKCAPALRAASVPHRGMSKCLERR